jgi:GT2 family glycosyltransferase
MMRASVVIPTHNRRDYVLAALHALTLQDFPAEWLELIVITDRCADGTKAAIDAAHRHSITVIDSPRPGKAAALNAGLAIATGDLCIFLDDEMIPSKSFVSAHVSRHLAEAGARIAVTGYSPVVLDENSTLLERYSADKYASYHSKLASASRAKAPTDMNGANFSIPAAAIRDVGGFDESYFFQRDDFELAARLIARGYEIRYEPRARADQHIAVNAEDVVNRAEPRAKNDIRLAREFPWCVPHLPFGILHRSRATRRRWRFLWHSGSAPTRLARMARAAGVSSVRLVGWEYTARYVAALRKELKDWEELLALGG